MHGTVALSCTILGEGDGITGTLTLKFCFNSLSCLFLARNIFKSDLCTTVVLSFLDSLVVCAGLVMLATFWFGFLSGFVLYFVSSGFGFIFIMSSKVFCIGFLFGFVSWVCWF